MKVAIYITKVSQWISVYVSLISYHANDSEKKFIKTEPLINIVDELENICDEGYCHIMQI